MMRTTSSSGLLLADWLLVASSSNQVQVRHTKLYGINSFPLASQLEHAQSRQLDQPPLSVVGFLILKFSKKRGNYWPRDTFQVDEKKKELNQRQMCIFFFKLWIVLIDTTKNGSFPRLLCVLLLNFSLNVILPRSQGQGFFQFQMYFLEERKKVSWLCLQSLHYKVSLI